MTENEPKVHFTGDVLKSATGVQLCSFRVICEELGVRLRIYRIIDQIKIQMTTFDWYKLEHFLLKCQRNAHSD